MFDFSFEIKSLDIRYYSCSHELQIFYETQTFIYSHKKLLQWLWNWLSCWQLAVSQNWIAAVKKMGHYPPENIPTLVLFTLRWNVHMRERSWASEAWSERPLPSSSLTPVEVEMEEVVEVERGGPLHPPQGQLRWRWWSRRGSPPPHLRSHPSVKVKRLLGQATRSPRH